MTMISKVKVGDQVDKLAMCCDKTCTDYDAYFDDNCGCYGMSVCKRDDRKLRWLKEAKEKIDDMSSAEFEAFIAACASIRIDT